MQSIPPTERRGRVHTSTISVAKSPLLQRADIDFGVGWFSGQGAGGQHGNEASLLAILK
ncbi:hypothetical protein FFR93_00390 [Rhizobium sp. MHM7A]|nr:hypothetical protein FFR93_00390 [Rhizobium sp. MHM7A]